MAGKWRQAMSYLGLGPDEDYDDYDPRDARPPEPPRPPRARPAVPGPRPPVAPAVRRSPPSAEFDDYDYDYDDQPADGTVVRVLPGQPPRPMPRSDDRQPRSSAVRPLPPPPQPVKPQKVVPRSFRDAQHIADAFRRRSPVVVNLEAVNRELARRLIDFASGVCYGLGGSMDQLSEDVFLLTPADVEIPPEDKRRMSDAAYD